jgi:HTH-type transcriptional regulator/antitoxin HipB
MPSHIPRQQNSLPESLRKSLIQARKDHGWTQAELGKRIGLPQMHVSSIETGKVVPRFDTLLELVRVLDHDLLLIPSSLVPLVQSMTTTPELGSQPLYALNEDPD